MLVRVVLILLAAWLVLVVLGALVKGLFWLLVVGAVLFLGTAAYGWAKTSLGSGSGRRQL